MKQKLALLLTLLMLFSVPACAATMSEPGTLPLSDETQTLSILLIDHVYVTDYDDNHFTQMIEEACNVELEFHFLPDADSEQKLNLMISSGEKLPDVICYSLSNADAYNYASTGVLLPLNDLIDQYCVNFKAICEAYPELQIAEKSTASDGNIYGIPLVFFATADSVWQNCWINQEWLDVVGKEMPTTTEELYDVLVAFRDGDPNGNGLNDEIPLTGATSGWSKNVIDWLLNSYVYANATDKINVKDGEIYAYYKTDAYKKGLAFINRLFEEGLLDSQTLTQTADQMMAQVMTEDANTIGAFMNMSPRRAPPISRCTRLRAPKALPIPLIMPVRFLRHGSSPRIARIPSWPSAWPIICSTMIPTSPIRTATARRTSIGCA